MLADKLDKIPDFDEQDKDGNDVMHPSQMTI
jgi:hypothetical protein